MSALKKFRHRPLRPRPPSLLRKPLQLRPNSRLRRRLRPRPNSLLHRLLRLNSLLPDRLRLLLRRPNRRHRLNNRLRLPINLPALTKATNAEDFIAYCAMKPFAFFVAGLADAAPR